MPNILLILNINNYGRLPTSKVLFPKIPRVGNIKLHKLQQNSTTAWGFSLMSGVSTRATIAKFKFSQFPRHFWKWF